MNKQSDRLRSQALQAERLSQTISDMPASRTLKAIAEQYHAQADELERAELGDQPVQQASAFQNTAPDSESHI